MTSELTEAPLTLVEAKYQNNQSIPSENVLYSNYFLSAPLFELRFCVRSFEGIVVFCKQCKDPIIIGRRKSK